MSNPPGPIGPYPEYPQPGQPQYPSFDPYASAAPACGPCRTAGLIQIIAGSLGVLLAFCLLSMGAMLGRDLFTPEQLAELNRVAGSTEALRTVLFVAGGCSGLPGLLLIVLGAFVWRGAKWAILSSMALTGVLLMLGLLGTALGVVRGEASVGSLCSNSVPTLVMAGLLATLIWALRGLNATNPQMSAYQQQWQQYYRYQQNMPPAPDSPPPLGPQPPDSLPPPPMPPASPSA